MFWALRGGGQFGVLLSTTYKLHPVPTTGYVGLTLEIGFLGGVNSTVM